MKVIVLITALVVLVVAAVARAEPYKSVKECGTYVTGDVCNKCCGQFNMATTKGRKVILSPFYSCKCITHEQKDKLEAEDRAKWAKYAAEPPYKSRRSCSDWNYKSKYCDECCRYFNEEPSKGWPSLFPRGEHVCKCVKPKEDESKPANVDSSLPVGQ